MLNLSAVRAECVREVTNRKLPYTPKASARGRVWISHVLAWLLFPRRRLCAAAAGNGLGRSHLTELL